MIEIIPAIIPKNVNIIRDRLDRVLGLVHKVQIDIIDGMYASAKTWPFNEHQFDYMRKVVEGEENFPYINDFILEIDMLVLHPIEYLTDFISLGAKSFIIHIDSTDHIKECISTIKNAGAKVGLGIKPSGDLSLLESFLPEADFVQFMGNDRVGHSGVELDKYVLEKIKNFHKRHPSSEIQIDIGVTEKTIPKLKDAGVDYFVSGSSIFNTNNPKEAIMRLQNF